MDALKMFCAIITVFCCANPTNVSSNSLQMENVIWSFTLDGKIKDKDRIHYLYLGDSDMGGRVNASSLPFPNLKYLKLKNSLRDMDLAFLRHMKSLIEVRLPGNNLARLNTGWFEGLNVEILDVSGNWIVHLDARLENLNGLRELDLSGNRIIYLPPECFKNIPVLFMLNLRGNRLMNVFPGTFKYTTLRILDLGGNRLDESLDPDAFTSPAISDINLSANRFKTLPCGLFRDLHFTYILDLSGNNVGSFSFGCIRHMTSLYILNMTAMGLSELPVDAFVSLRNLREVYLSFNNLTRVDPAVFPKQQYLNSLDLSHNQLTSLEWNRNQRTYLYTLDLSYNRFEILKHDFWYHARIVILSHNAIRHIEIRVGTHLPHKMYLDNNCIVHLNTSVILALQPTQEMSVIENPWDCECYKDFVTVYRNQYRTRTLGKSTRPYCAAVNVDKCIVTEAIEREVYDSFRHVQPYPFAKCEP